MALPPLTPEQRAAALEKAARLAGAGRGQEPAEALGGLAVRGHPSQGETDDIVGKMRVTALLESMPGVGKVRARQIMERLGISPRADGSGGSAPTRSRRSSASSADALTGEPSDLPTPAPPAPARRAVRPLAGSARAPSWSRLRAHHPEIWQSVSATTRAPRPGEVDGLSLLLRHRARSSTSSVATGALLEWAEFAGNRYGTPRQPVEERLRPGSRCCWRSSWRVPGRSGRPCRRRCWCSLTPPSWEVWQRGWSAGGPRTRGRSPGGWPGRVELAAATEFDVVLVNDDVRAGAAISLGSTCSTVRLKSSDPIRSRASAVLTQLTTSGVTRVRSPRRPRGHHQPAHRRAAHKVDSKYGLVLYSAKRARQINAYYSQLGEGLLEYVGPLVETHVQEKPLSIAMREINADLLTIEKTDGEG